MGRDPEATWTAVPPPAVSRQRSADAVLQHPFGILLRRPLDDRLAGHRRARCPTLDPVERLLFNLLAMVAEFKSNLIRLRTREGMKVAKAQGRLRGKQPKLKPNQAKHLLELYNSGEYTQSEFAELFGVGRSTVYRTIEGMRPKPPELQRPFAHLAHRYGSDAHAPEGKA